jgi:hypothetical protein
MATVLVGTSGKPSLMFFHDFPASVVLKTCGTPKPEYTTMHVFLSTLENAKSLTQRLTSPFPVTSVHFVPPSVVNITSPISVPATI